MSGRYPDLRWVARLQRGSGPVYLALATALEAAVREGELQPGDKLPSQREIAERLDVDLTTVTRAFNAARDRGLIEGVVGRGTFVKAPAAEDDVGLVDLSMNLPPPPDGLSLAALLRDTTTAVLQRTDVAALMTYHEGLGTLGLKAAGAAWLTPCLGEVAPGRVLVTAGAQAGLAGVLGAMTRPGDGLVVEPLTYPGIKGLAAQLGLRLIVCPVDGEGIDPAALDAICRRERPVALYLVPTLQNPTTVTMHLARRQAVATVVSAQGLWLVEDDPYSRLLEAPLPAISSLVPQRGFYLATLAKTLSPGLRIGFVVCPEGAVTEAVAASLRALMLMPAPLMGAVVTQWIRDGAAEQLLAGVRREARARRALAAEILPQAVGAAESLHVWLPLSADWDAGRLKAAARGQGVSLVAAEAFATGTAFESGARISLGGPVRRAVLERALKGIAGMVGQGSGGGGVSGT